MTPTPADTIRRGTEALLDALGLEGTLRFLQHLDRGHGDYTRERTTWLGDETADAIYQQILKARPAPGDDAG